MNSITEKAMLVSLSITQWTARKTDKKITQEVNNAHNAGPDAGKYQKQLMAKERIERIQQIANAARTYHYDNTLPWSNDGSRILPSGNFAEYSAGIRKLRSEFEATVTDFVRDYDQFVSEERQRLNGMFREDDYPPVDAVAKKYGFDFQVNPLPAAQDFRVTIADDEIHAIRADIETRLNEATRAAMKDLWTRVHEAVKHMAAKLADADAIFRDSLIGNIRDLVDLLPRLNVTNDPALETARREIADKLLIHNAETLRRNSTARKQTADDARAILDRMAAYCG